MSFKEEREKKREIQLLLVGKGMLESALSIQNHIQINDAESKENIGKEIIKLIQGAEIYGEAIIKDVHIKKQYKALLADTKKNIEVCKIATVDIAILAAKLAISSIKDTVDLVESKALTYISIAVAWGADLIRKIIEGAEHARLIEETEIVIHKIKEAIDVTVQYIEQTTPSILNDLEWREVKQAIILQNLFGKSVMQCQEEQKDSFDFRMDKLLEIIEMGLMNLKRRIRAL